MDLMENSWKTYDKFNINLERHIKVKLKMVKNMVPASCNRITAIFILENGKMMCIVEREYLFIKMGNGMKDRWGIIRKMDKEYITILMVDCIKAFGLMIKSMDMGPNKVHIFMRANGRTAYGMERDISNWKMDRSTKDYFKTASLMVKEDIKIK